MSLVTNDYFDCDNCNPKVGDIVNGKIIEGIDGPWVKFVDINVIWGMTGIVGGTRFFETVFKH